MFITYMYIKVLTRNLKTGAEEQVRRVFHDD